MTAEVIPEKRTSPDKHTFSYLVPENLEDSIQIGSIVEIPFGKKTIRGVVKNCHHEPETMDKLDYELKEINSICSDFIIPQKYLKIAEWIAEYYLCSLAEATALFLPPKISRPRKQGAKTKEQGTRGNTIELNSEQQEAYEKLLLSLNSENRRPFLLHGVTGSGKTEIYLKLTEECLKLGKQVIVLVPEIMLTPQTVARFEAKFGQQICLIHSGLSKSERFFSYQQFSDGEKKIIIGPRSALLVPSENIGLIIIDEEQEDAYKQEKDPRYQAVKLAEKIAETMDALLLLGTATPRVETYYKTSEEDCHALASARARNDVKYELLELKNRFQKLILPTAEVVDLKNEIKHDNFSPISIKLQKKIKEILARGRQIILFLNRRGMSTFVSCRDCGEIINCPRCEIPLVHHMNSNQNYLNCHHCDFKQAIPQHCPVCGSARIKFFGAGVDKIEAEITKLFPKARIKKIDAKSLQNKGDYEKLYEELKKGEIDILIGTQILAKGLDVPTVDLVGVISADVGLHLPYYLASEKTFQILTQVSGRSGRRDNPGATVIQTYWPESLAIQKAALHDYKSLFETEICERKKFDYPPFCHLVRVIAEDANPRKAKEAIASIAEKLKAGKIDFIGPAACFLAKINNRYRYHLVIKTINLPDPKITEIFKTNPYLTWDVDPVDLL